MYSTSEVTARRERLGFVSAKPVVRVNIPQAKPRDIINVAAPVVEDAIAPAPEWLIPPSHWQVIVREVCEKYGISKLDLISARRAVPYTHARHEAMYRMRHETPLSLPQIGKKLGGRDHTTVWSGINSHIRRLGANDDSKE